MGFLDSLSHAADSIKKGVEEAASGVQNTAENTVSSLQTGSAQ